MTEDGISKEIRSIREEIEEVRQDLYGNPQRRQRGVFDRLEHAEERLTELLESYEREKMDREQLAQLPHKVNQIQLNAELASLRVKGLLAIGVSVFGVLLTAGVVGAVRLLGGS